MAKFDRIPKLNKQKRQELIISLCEALTSIRKPEEAAKFLTDLLSPQELQMLAKRLEIAKALVEGFTYEEIKSDLKVGMGTIARVNTWLNLQGEGFKLVISRTRKRKKIYEHSDDEIYDPLSWYNIKRRYSKYYWPELLLEELIKKSDQKQKKNIITILQSMEVKSEVMKEVNRQMLEKYGVPNGKRLKYSHE